MLINHQLNKFNFTVLNYTCEQGEKEIIVKQNSFELKIFDFILWYIRKFLGNGLKIEFFFEIRLNGVSQSIM